MGQCTSCSTQRPNFSSVPQTPEFELNPDSVFPVPPTARLSTSGKVHTALKIRSKIKKPSTHSIPAPAPQNLATEDGSLNFHEARDKPGNFKQKSSKKHRISPQTDSTSTVRKNGVFLWNKRSKSEQSDVNSSPPALLRKFLFLQTQSSGDNSKASATIRAKSNGKTSNSNNNETTKAHSCAKEPQADAQGCGVTSDNNNTQLNTEQLGSFKTTTQEKSSYGPTSQIFRSEGPISAVTLNALNSNRGEKKQLRDLFLFGTTDTTTVPTTTVTNSISSGYFSLSLFIASSEMDTKRTNPTTTFTRTNAGDCLPPGRQQPPEKVKRTFQYQPPKQSSTNSKIPTFNLNQGAHAFGSTTGSNLSVRLQPVHNANLSRHGENTRLFGGGGSQTAFRTYPNLAPPASKTVTSTNTLAPISEQNNNSYETSSSNNATRGHRTTLRKPVEPRPFHTILYPIRNQNLQPVPTLGLKGLHSANTGVVLQRKMFNQGKNGEQKDTLPASKRKIDASSSSKKILESHAKTSYPLQHDSSSSSGEFGKMAHHRGSGDHHNVSDSEYLDDEISDQPDLTLTFKDLSPSSSGESLVSCDMMLEKRVNREDGFAREGDMASDSAFSDTSSTKAIPASASATRLSSIDRLSSPKHRVASVHVITPKAPSPSKPKPKQNFILKNLQQVCSPRDRKDGTKTHSTEQTHLTNETSPKEPKSVSPSKVKASDRQTDGLFDTPSSLADEKLIAASNELVTKGVMEDIEYLRTQLVVLKEVLEEKERLDAEKDKTIEKLMLEIDILKRKNNERNGSGMAGRLKCLNLDCEPPTANAAAQTDSDTISPIRGISYDECDKFGELVSFRIGRRISPSSSSLSGKSPDTSIE